MVKVGQGWKVVGLSLTGPGGKCRTQPPSPGPWRTSWRPGHAECRIGSRAVTIKLEVTVDGVDAVDGVDLNGSARTPARPPPFDTPTLSDLSSSLR